MRFPIFTTSILPAAFLTLLHTTSAKYADDYAYPTVSPLYLTASLSSTTQPAFYPYPTSSAAQNCSCHHHTDPDPQHQHETYISVIYGTASRGSSSAYEIASGSENATYQSPVPSTEAPTSAAETMSSAAAESSGTSSEASSVLSGTTSESPSPTQTEEPPEPIFTGSALKLPELQVWKWNIIVSVGLGLMVMWI